MTIRTRVIVATVLLLVIVNLFFVEAYTNARFAPDQRGVEVGSQSAVPAAILTGGPLVDGPLSYAMPKQTIALTFDDGPDPRWTPQILDVLRRNGVPATFFVIGSEVARHPELTRQIVVQGNEVGLHTFTHPRISQLPPWRRRAEYAQNQMAIVHATGVESRLLRLPYSSGVDSIDNRTWPLVGEAHRLGYLTVFSDTDSRDWERPGVAAILHNVTPAPGRGTVVLMHDGGGDRAQTVRALDLLIPLLKQEGFRFTTVSAGFEQARPHPEVARPPQAAAPPPAAPGITSDWRADTLVWSVHAADTTVTICWGILLGVGLLALLRTLLLCWYAIGHVRRRRDPDFSWGFPMRDPVSIVVPAWNEREGIAATVRSLVLSEHPVEVLVVDDASTDGTAGVVQALRLPGVRVIQVVAGGKAAALNAGIAMARHPIIVMVDADTVVEPEAVHRLVQPFADPSVGAVAGNVKVGNRTGLVARWQHIEYVIGFNLDRRLYERFNCIPTVPGALGAFRRPAVLALGGVTDDTLAEDTDLTIALHRVGWRVVYVEDARAWTEAPATVGQLWRQRYRWSYGTMQALWKHRSALRDRGVPAGFGRYRLPLLAVFTVLLPLLAPIVDLFAVYGLVFLDRTATAVAWLALLLVQTSTAVLAFRLDRERLRPLWALPLQQIAYRQLMYLVLIHSMLTAMSGGRLRWQKLRRTGQAAHSAPMV